MINKRMQGLGEARSVIREIFEYGNRRKREIGAERVFDFSLGNPNVPPPAVVNARIAQLIAGEDQTSVHGYTSAAGAPEVRRAVADYLKNTFSVDMTEDYIYMTCGAAASLTVTLHALLSGGEEVVVIAPYFPEYRVFIEQAGGVCREVGAAEDFHLDLAALDSAIGENTAAVILNSPNNPTGVVYGEGELRALAALLARKNAEREQPVVLIADEPYRELTYGAQVPQLLALYEHTVVCYSFSKSLSLAGERIGYIAVSPRARGAAQLYAAVCGAGRALGYVCAPALFQRVVASCLGQSSELAFYQTNRDLLYGALTEMGFSCVPPEGAFYLFMQAPEGDAAAFCARAREHELLLVPSDSFGRGGYVRISYCVARETIKNSLPAFRALAKSYHL